MKLFMNVLLASVAFVSLAGIARAADITPSVPSEVSSVGGFYVRGDIGGSYLNWGNASQAWAPVGALGVGYQLDHNFRADVTYTLAAPTWISSYTVNPGASLSTGIVLANAYFDWKNDSAFTPYVGAGVGYGWAWSGNSVQVPNNQGIAIGLAAGVGYELTNNLALDVGYHFHDIFVSGGTTVPEHSVTAGVRVTF